MYQMAAEVWSLETRAWGICIAAIGKWLFNFAIGTALLQTRWGLFIVFGCICLGGAIQFWLTYSETCGETIEEIEIMFSDGKPRAWKTKKGYSNLDRDIEEVINAQAKGDDARNSISEIIEEKRAASIIAQNETV